MERTVGFLGLGQIGEPMAINLAKAGYLPVTTSHRREEPVVRVVEAGGIRVSSAREVAERTQIIFLSMPDPKAVLDLLRAENGLLAGLQPGSVVVDTGTTGVKVTRICVDAAAEKGCDWLDAPISGGVWAARAGTLTIMVGGEAGVIKRVMPYLQPMSSRIVHVGPSGSGQVVKLINNLMACINTAAVSEAFSLGVKAGIDVKALHEVISASSGSNWVLENAAPRTIFVGNYQPGGRLKTMLKDLGLVNEIANEFMTPLLLGSLVTQLHTLMVARGYGEEDAGVLARFYEEILDVSLVSEKFMEEQNERA
jgi:3-hydroxyisobutyrate dehydrogenase-like beta-hydroxyacid dehydrogenase